MYSLALPPISCESASNACLDSTNMTIFPPQTSSFGPLNMQVVCCLCSGITIYLMVREERLALANARGKLTSQCAASHDQRVDAHPLGSPVRFLHRRFCLARVSGDCEHLGQQSRRDRVRFHSFRRLTHSGRDVLPFRPETVSLVTDSDKGLPLSSSPAPRSVATQSADACSRTRRATFSTRSCLRVQP